jgi:uncharacterized protein YdgA (DUF945 family)
MRALDARPVQAVVETEIRPSAAAEALPLRIQTVLTLDGAAVTEIGGPAYAGPLTEKGGDTVQWEGLQGSMRFPADWLRLDGNIEVPGLRVNGPTGGWAVTGLRFRLDLHQGLEGLTLGEMSIAASELAYRASAEDVRAVRLSGGRLHTESTAQGGQVNVAVDLRVEGLDVVDSRYGPLTFNLLLSRLDAPTLGRLRREVRVLEREGLGDDEARLVALLRLTELFPRLLAVGPRVELQLAATAPSGALRGTGALWLEADPELLPILSPRWLDRLTGEAELRAPVPMLDELTADAEEGAGVQEPASEGASSPRERLRFLQEHGYLVQEAGDYVLRARYEGRQLTVNGRAVDLSPLSRH